MVNLVLVVGFVVLASQHKVVPWIVEVDDLGQAHTIGQLIAAAPPERVVQVTLIRWIHDMRSVPRDLHMLNIGHKRAAAHVAGTAAETFSIEMQGENDAILALYKVGGSRYVSAITHVLPLPDAESTYRVSWQETVTGRGGESREAYEGHFHMQTLPPRGDATLIDNPMGIYVTSFAFAQVAAGEGEVR